MLGKAPTIKKNLRKFDGFEFEADSDEYKAKVEAAHKLDIAKLKALCDAFDIDKKGRCSKRVSITHKYALQCVCSIQ